MSLECIARSDIVTLKAYVAAAQVDETIRLNANELPLGLAGDPNLAALNRYPEVRPRQLTLRLADLYGVQPENLIVTRGSSEAIDVLVRSCCRAYRDAVVTMSPSFGMYRVYADIQAARVIEFVLDGQKNFNLDPERLLDACTDNVRLIFLCTPNNPTGTSVPSDSVLRIADARQGKSIVVADEAYIEFSGHESLAGEAAARENLVVLRTLSKAHAMAGARCGAAVGSRELVTLLSRVLPPYSFPTPVTQCVLRALEPGNLDATTRIVRDIIRERERLQQALAKLPIISRIWRSDANFLLVEFVDIDWVTQCLAGERILVRRYESPAALANCARITVGAPRENDALLRALRSFPDRGAER